MRILKILLPFLSLIIIIKGKEGEEKESGEIAPTAREFGKYSFSMFLYVWEEQKECQTSYLFSLTESYVCEENSDSASNLEEETKNFG